MNWKLRIKTPQWTLESHDPRYREIGKLKNDMRLKNKIIVLLEDELKQLRDELEKLKRSE